MCEPASIAAGMTFLGAHAGTIMAGTTIASTGLAVAGGVHASKTRQAGLAYENNVANVNAVYADRAARDALERGEEEAVAHGRKVAGLRGVQTAGMAAMGLELGYGTPLDIATDTDLLAAEDRRRIYENAQREGDTHRISAANYRAKGAGAMMQRSAEKSAMYINAGSTLLGGATQLAGVGAKYYGKS